MSRVDFYILAEGTQPERFACSLTAKAWSNGKRVHIHAADERAASGLDDLLWTYRDISFIPHAIYSTEAVDSEPVTIGFGSHYPAHNEVVINLDQEIPDYFSSYERVVEIVGGNEQRKQLARQRYRHYRDNNYEIHDHKIDKPGEHG